MRAWGLIMLPVTALAVAPFVTELRRQSRAEKLAAELERVEDALRTLRRDVTATASAVQDVEMRIARARALRTKRSWSGLLGLLARCSPDEVWFTEVSSPADAPVAAKPARAASATEPVTDGQPLVQVVTLEAATRLQLTGYAVNHERLYDLMSRLKEAGVFTSVELVKAGMEPVFEGRAAKFVLACTW
jgi:Tfp pilus assembly protein PilN